MTRYHLQMSNSPACRSLSRPRGSRTSDDGYGVETHSKSYPDINVRRAIHSLTRIPSMSQLSSGILKAGLEEMTARGNARRC